MKNIIVVDMQKGFLKETNCCLIEKINNYLQQNIFDNIFFTKCINNNSSPYTEILNWDGVKKKMNNKLFVKYQSRHILLQKIVMEFLMKILNCIKI